MDAAPLQLILAMYTVVLLAVVFAVVAILVGARAVEQFGQIGLLKAVGLTPRQVSAVFVIESAVLGLVATGIGFAVGTLVAPQLARATAQTMPGPPTVAANPAHLVVAAVPLMLVLVLSTWLAGGVPASRCSTRSSQAGPRLPVGRCSSGWRWHCHWASRSRSAHARSWPAGPACSCSSARSR
jgi:putative ABC transport system permease protein